MKIKILKLITFNLFLVFIFIGCEKEYDSVIENSIYDYSVKSVSPTDSVKYLVTDSLITIKISFGSFCRLWSLISL